MQITEFEPQDETRRLGNDLNAISTKSLRSKKVVDITFTNIQYSVTSQNKVKREILKNITGYCPGGEVTAILGSSGAGKTSLLNILAARVKTRGNVELKGDLKANNKLYNADRFSEFASYVMQNDVLFETLSPRESFEFVANLKYKDPELKKKRIDDTVKTMKLEKCQHALIGGASFKGISGGERKRTSIGFELVTNPSCILLDEPTSGLDSFTAFQIIHELAQLAHDQDRTIIFTIHQPSSDIYLLFDRVMLLVQGQFIYQGPRVSLINYFGDIGFKCPDHSNPMDYLISITHGEDQKNHANYPIYFANYQEKLHPLVLDDIKKQSLAELENKQVETNFLYQIGKITDRSIKGFLRDKLILRQRIGTAIFMGLIVGGAFWGIGENNGTYSSMANVAGLVFLLSLNLTMGALSPVILQFSVERDVFLREENSKLYTTFSYFVGKSCVEIPFCILTPIIQELILYWMVDLDYQDAGVVLIHLLISILMCVNGNSLGLMAGCAFNDIKTALGIVPLLILPLVIFSGFFANSKNFYVWIGWIQYLSPMKYGFEAMAYNEFQNRVYETDPINQYDFQIGVWGCVGVLIGFAIVYRFIAFLFLYALRSKQQ